MKDIFLWKLIQNKRDRRIKQYSLNLDDNLYAWEIQSIFKKIIKTKWESRKLLRQLRQELKQNKDCKLENWKKKI